MHTDNKKHLKIWEMSLLIAICICFCTGIWAHAQQRELSDQLIRLHVIAQSDSEEDQAVKLKVRDAVLSFIEPKLESAQTKEQARIIISQNLNGIRLIANEALAGNGHSERSCATLSTERYPTRFYDGFSLPAGDYLSLRVILGSGEGHNWWCVVFPPLCMASSADEDAFSQLTSQAEDMIVSEDGDYCLKFRIVELFEQIRQLMNQQ